MSPIWLVGDETVTLEMGESAIVLCAASRKVVEGEPFAVFPNAASVCRTGGGMGFDGGLCVGD